MTDANPTVSMATLLKHASWVRGLAFSLVGNAQDAEDLINDTWVRAVAHPPSEGGDLKAWFRRVMRNVVRERHRSNVARTAREQRTPSTREVERPDETVQRAEALRRVAGHVLALPEPYRRTVLLRHFEELTPDQISERFGDPVETTRTRLKRAYAMLRERLEDEDGDAWPLALAPLLRWPAGPGSVPLPDAPKTPTVGAGIQVIGVVAIATAVGLVLWSNTDGPRTIVAGAQQGPRTTRGGDGAAPPRRSDAAGVGDANSARAAADSPPASVADLRTITFTGEIVADVGPPPGETRVQATALLAAQAVKDPMTRDGLASGGTMSIALPRTDDSGRRVVEWELQIDHPDFLPCSARVRVPFPSDGITTARMDPIRLRRAGHVTGTVMFEPAVVGDTATIGTAAQEAGSWGTFDTVTAAPGARFRVRAQPGRPMLVAAVANDRLPAAREVRVDAGGESDVGVLALAEGVRIAGKIATEPPLRQMGNPTVSVVSIEPPKVYVGVGGQFLSFENGSVRRYMAVTSVAADGTFAVGGLPPGRYVLHDNATGVSKAMSQALLQPFDAPTDRADFIYRGVIVSVLVRRGGAPAKGASLSVTGGGGDRVGDDGIARFLAEPGASYEVEARLKGCPSVQATVIAPAAAVAGGTPTATIDLPEPAAVPPPATWTLTIQPDGAASPTAAGIGFFAVKAGKPALFPAFTRDATGDGGVFTVTDIPPGHWRIEIRAGAAWADPSGFLVTAPVERELASGETAADVVRATPGGRLVVSVQEADESRATGVICKLTDAAHAQVPVWLGTHRFVNGYSSQSSSTALSDFAPSDVFPALPPGRYTLEFTRYGASGPVTVTVPADVVAGKVTEVSAKLPPR